MMSPFTLVPVLLPLPISMVRVAEILSPFTPRMVTSKVRVSSSAFRSAAKVSVSSSKS